MNDTSFLSRKEKAVTMEPLTWKRIQKKPAISSMWVLRLGVCQVDILELHQLLRLKFSLQPTSCVWKWCYLNFIKCREKKATIPTCTETGPIHYISVMFLCMFMSSATLTWSALHNVGRTSGDRCLVEFHLDTFNVNKLWINQGTGVNFQGVALHSMWSGAGRCSLTAVHFGR